MPPLIGVLGLDAIHFNLGFRRTNHMSHKTFSRLCEAMVLAGLALLIATEVQAKMITKAVEYKQDGTVMQGFIETSNVNVVTEITNLITAQRAYEMNSKVITTSDDMMSTLTNLR